ncbi:MAG: NfeD family protein [Spirochaetales bacterium]|nr:NfeD family protein [Spirochaetales bacterium]
MFIFNPVFVWAFLGLLFIGLEFAIPGLVISFFGAGALITSLLTAIVPGLRSSVVWQVLLWLGTSSLSLAFLRRYLSKVFRGTTLIGSGDQASGRTAEVIERITPEAPGRVHFEGTSWKAASYTETLEKGETVTVLKQDGLTLIVSKSLIEPVYEDENDKSG